MAIASVSGGSSSAPVRTNTELVRKEEEDSEEKASEKEAVDQQDDEARSKAAANEGKLEEVKGVKEVDARA